MMMMMSMMMMVMMTSSHASHAASKHHVEDVHRGTETPCALQSSNCQYHHHDYNLDDQIQRNHHNANYRHDHYNDHQTSIS